MALDTTTLRHPVVEFQFREQGMSFVYMSHEHLFRITSASGCCVHPQYMLNVKRRRLVFEGNKSVIHFPHILDKLDFRLTFF